MENWNKNDMNPIDNNNNEDKENKKNKKKITFKRERESPFAQCLQEAWFLKESMQ